MITVHILNIIYLQGPRPGPRAAPDAPRLAEEVVEGRHEVAFV